MACFHCNTTENFIFLLKYRQRNFDLNTSKKLLVFVTIRPAIIYESFIFTQKYAFAERYCFLTFSFKGKLRKYDISVKRKHTKSNENITFSALFTHFHNENSFFMQWNHCKITRKSCSNIWQHVSKSANLIPKVGREISYPGDTTFAKQQLGAKLTDTKILGINWHENKDTLSVEIPKSKGKHTKHNILSHLALIYASEIYLSSPSPG